MKKKLLFLKLFFLPFFVLIAKTTYTYTLVNSQKELDGNYVYPNALNLYQYYVSLTPDYSGSAPAEFTISLENGKSSDGKKEFKIYPNERFYVVWDDIANNGGNVAEIKIKNKTVIDTANTIINAGSPIQLSHWIASLKGRIPVSSINPSNPVMGNTLPITGVISTMKFWSALPNEAEYYEWTLPAGWKTTTDKTGTFDLTSDSCNISIIPDKFSMGQIKVRALNIKRSAGSEYKTYKIDRGFIFTNFPTSITLGDTDAKTVAVTAFSGVTYEWNVPEGWKINGQGNILEGYQMNSVNISPSFCNTAGNTKVRVRIKNSEETSASWLDSSINISIPSVSLSPTTIYQFEETNVSLLNINTTNIQSVTYSGNGVCDNVSQGVHKINFTQSGTVVLTISVQMNDCNNPLTYKDTITVLPSRISITGPTHVCPLSTAIFEVNNSPGNYSWAYSSNLTPVSGNPGSFTTASSGGTAWVSINVCGNEVARKNFIIGSNINGPGEIPYIQTTRYVPDPSCPEQVDMWILDWQGRLIYSEKADTVYGNLSFGSDHVDIVSSSSPGLMTIYDLTLVQKNGTRTIKWINVRDIKLNLVGPPDRPEPFDPFPPLEMLLYPNPTSELLTIEIKTDETKNSAKASSLKSKKSLEPYTVQLWNERQVLVRSIESTDLKQQISVNELPTGMYFVSLIKNGKRLYRQIFWKN
jgi:hypothetical protein